MAWTAPRTWVAGEIVTAALMNTHLRDNLLAIGDPTAAWTTYTPTFSGTLGNGTITGQYAKTGRRVHFIVRFTFGSTSTMGADFGLPVAAAARTITGKIHGRVVDVSAGPNHYLVGGGIGSGATAVAPVAHGQTALTGSVPITWASGDVLEIQGTYEAAS